jgi:hypothetical protein
LDPGATIRRDRDLQEQKQLSPRTSTDAGRKIEINEEQLINALGSIRERRESGSKPSVLRDEHELKQLSQIISIDEGI